MSKRKISEAINVRINVGNYQHIEISKYAEEEIEFSSVEDRIEKENEFTVDLVDSLKRSLKLIPEKLGMGVAEAQKVEEAIQKAIPEWLKDNPVPNIAKNKHIQVTAEQKNKKDTANDLIKKAIEENEQSDDVQEELFDEDALAEPETSTEVETKPEEEQKKELVAAGESSIDDDLFDDDLFDD